ncbi:unnamed protein product [Pleuronectes platessa]|uniref:Uncharacterized protein n=1 Tax=Pleuronectes platessa TaxID=8262 RepID=A0A9N7UBN3_PLEPL|nr:unnamed protein product [Pleuronectes platessa]
MTRMLFWRERRKRSTEEDGEMRRVWQGHRQRETAKDFQDERHDCWDSADDPRYIPSSSWSYRTFSSVHCSWTTRAGVLPWL